MLKQQQLKLEAINQRLNFVWNAIANGMGLFSSGAELIFLFLLLFLFLFFIYIYICICIKQLQTGLFNFGVEMESIQWNKSNLIPSAIIL